MSNKKGVSRKGRQDSAKDAILYYPLRTLRNLSVFA